MKVHINREPFNGPWGGGALFVNAFHKHINDVGGTLVGDAMTDVPDVILLAGLDDNGGIAAEQAIMYKLYNPKVKVVLRVNENDARKGTSHMDAYLLKLAPHLDGTVFVSHWLQEYFEAKGWPKTNSTVIYNGVNRENFKPQPKLNNGKLNIVAHHWSDNRMKGADIYEELDKFVGQNPDKYSFTYIGRHQCNFKNTTVIRPLSGKKLGEELGKYDVYVSASRHDPGPNHILESLACGLPTYAIDVGGGGAEFVTAYQPGHLYRNWDDLKAILLKRVEDPSLFTQEFPFTHPTWQECIREYNCFLESLVKSHEAKTTP